MRSEIPAWVESPLQLLGALEHAALTEQGTVTIFPRGGDAQLEYTATHLADQVAGAADLRAHIALDRRVMPRQFFVDGAPWIIGDPYSGQVQARLDRAQPSTLTLVDDGAITRLLAEQLRAGAPLLRPRPPRWLPAMRRELARRTTRQLLALAAEGRLTVTTYLQRHDPAVETLLALGARVTTHRFDATRRWGDRAVAVPRNALIVLGTARVADGLADASAELHRIARLAHSARVVYLPHRREPHWFLTAVGRTPDVTVITARLPIELALAGTDQALEIIAGASTAAETLPIVLRGTGSIVRPESAIAGTRS